jgi:hypothetical protein
MTKPSQARLNMIEFYLDWCQLYFINSRSLAFGVSISNADRNAAIMTSIAI